jgi:hypothetical protein
MEYLIWFITFSMVAAAVTFGIRARRAISEMQNYVNSQRDDSRMEIWHSLDANRVIREYRRTNPGGRHFTHYKLSMFAFFICIIFAAGLFLFNIWYLNPVEVTPDRPYLRDEIPEMSQTARD